MEVTAVLSRIESAGSSFDIPLEIDCVPSWRRRY